METKTLQEFSKAVVTEYEKAVEKSCSNRNLTAQQLWEAIKFSNQNKDGSLDMSKERVDAIDKIFEQSEVKKEKD